MRMAIRLLLGSKRLTTSGCSRQALRQTRLPPALLLIRSALGHPKIGCLAETLWTRVFQENGGVLYSDEGNMGQAINFFAEDPGRYERFQQHFIAQNIIDDVIDEILERHSDALKEREGEESDLSRLVAGLCFGKAHKTFHAIIRLCALGFGEDAAILLRSNINLLINI